MLIKMLEEKLSAGNETPLHDGISANNNHDGACEETRPEIAVVKQIIGKRKYVDWSRQ